MEKEKEKQKKRIEWLKWQKSVINEEYDDIIIMLKSPQITTSKRKK